jgi:hypothetical protein
MRLNFVHPTIGSTVVNIDKHEIKVINTDLLSFKRTFNTLRLYSSSVSGN